MQRNHTTEQLQAEWDRAVERAARENARDQDLGEMLTHGAGLHINSGVQAGGLWGTTSCTCAASCDCPETVRLCGT